MAVSKVVYGTTVLVDLTSDTVSASTLALGSTAHGRDGETISGTAPVYGGVTSFSDQGLTAIDYVAAAESAYSDSDYASNSVVGSYASTSEHRDALRPATFASPVTGTGAVACVERPGLSWAAAATAGSDVSLCDFVPGTTDHVLMAASDGTVVGVQTLGIHDHGFRVVGDASGDYNARDLGGAACDGGTVHYGVLYRGSDVSGKAGFRAVAADVLHVQDEVDIQGAESTATASCFSGAAYHHYPLDTPSSYEELYKLDGTSYPTVKECLEHVMQNACAGVVTYVHCSLGADRTGAICFWLQGILGVSGKHLDISYELTALAGKMWGTSDVTTRKRTYAPWVGLRKYFSGLGGTSTIRDACLWWAYKAGIGIDLVNAYRAAMSTGTPETLSYKRWDVSYTNQIPISTDTDGSVFNGVGFKTGYKLSGSGALESYSGIEVTGFIPCVKGDVVRLSGIAMSKNDNDAGSVDRISFYDGSKAHLQTINVMQNSVGWWGASYDSDGNLTQFTNTKATTSAYMRLSAHEIDADSVITINEEIK
jgi:hypothetical protein